MAKIEVPAIGIVRFKKMLEIKGVGLVAVAGLCLILIKTFSANQILLLIL